MNAPSPQSLESALRRKLADDPAILADSIRFDELCRPYFSKSSAIKAMKSYLSGHEAAPAVLGCLIYSKGGLRELQSWISTGMPVSYLYRSMLHDGGSWRDINPGLQITDDIVHGDERWDFDYRLLVEAIYPHAIVPGLIKAVVNRAALKDQLKTMVSVLPQQRLCALIEAFPEAFVGVLDQLKIPDGASPAEIARKMCSNWLTPERSILKMLLHTA